MRSVFVIKSLIMSLNVNIIRQFIVSSVLLSTLQCSSAARFSRSMQYPAPSMRKYTHPWKYVPLIQMPRGMQRRFMWKEMDDTHDGLMANVANVARTMTQVYSPSMIRYRKPFDFETQPSKKVKYIIKKPPAPPPPPFKRMKIIKFNRGPIKQPIPLYNHVTIADPPSAAILTTPRPSVIMQFMSEEELRKIEKEQEKRVESESAGGIHEHSHQTHIDDDVVSGRINEFGEGWLPMKGPFSTPKSFAVSRLHTNVEGFTTAIPAPTALSLILSKPFTNKLSSYEVTEHSAEASVQKEQTFKPSTFQFDFLTATTTEGPNYPEHFLKSFSKNEDDFQPMRVPITTTVVATITTTPSPRRLPPRSTTEHPFKRYNLHRPKPSKLLFHRTTSSPDSRNETQPTSTTENSFKSTLELHQEPVKTTRESIKTTPEPSSTTSSTKAKEPKKTPPEKVRATRMNFEGKSKLRIKNVSQNESLNKVLNKHRGSVKFGEKTKAS